MLTTSDALGRMHRRMKTHDLSPAFAQLGSNWGRDSQEAGSKRWDLILISVGRLPMKVLKFFSNANRRFQRAFRLCEWSTMFADWHIALPSSQRILQEIRRSPSRVLLLLRMGSGIARERSRSCASDGRKMVSGVWTRKHFLLARQRGRMTSRWPPRPSSRRDGGGRAAEGRRMRKHPRPT